MSLDIYSNLEKELEKARTNLKDLNENISRIFGKKDNFNNKRNSAIGHTDASQRRVDTKKDRLLDAPPAKRRQEFTPKVSAFNRLSSKKEGNNQYIRDDEIEDYQRPKVSSRVISKEQITSREDALAMQARNNDLARNKRMFGSLLGTLQKFQKEESRLKPKEDKKAQIEKKLEEQELLEKEKMKQEKEVLMADKKRKQLEIRAIEIKMFKMRDLKAWEDSKLPLVNFIGTKTEPQLFYLPKVMTPKTEELLVESQHAVQKQIEEKREQVHQQIRELELRFESDIKALKDGKLPSRTIDEDDTDSVYNSDFENDHKATKEVLKREDEDKTIDRKRKRSFSPELDQGRVKSQVVIKREQDN